MTLHPDLEQLGAELERMVDDSTSTHRRIRRRWSRPVIVVGSAVVLAGAGVGTAAALGAFTPAQVGSAMTHSSLLFLDQQADCVDNADGSVTCTLAQAPTGDPTFVAGRFQGAVVPFTIDGRVAGGCRGANADGTTWTCWSGQAAVDNGTIGQELLGGLVGDGPGVG